MINLGFDSYFFRVILLDMLRRMSLAEVKDILKSWREDNTRKSDEIIEYWEDTIRDEIDDLGKGYLLLSL